jgi:hypothetical protein
MIPHPFRSSVRPPHWAAVFLASGWWPVAIPSDLADLGTR